MIDSMLTDLFYTLNFTISIIASVIGLIFSTIVLCVIITHRTCHSPANLLVCNKKLAVILFLIITLIGSTYGFRQDWAENQPLCSLRAHCYLMSCGVICYANLIEALSRLFFIVFYHRKSLQSFQLHGYLIAFNWIIGLVFPFGASAFDGGRKYESESRFCLFTTKNGRSGLYILCIGFIVPLSLALIIYFIIFIEIQRSSRRVAPLTSDNHLQQNTRVKREFILARHLFILMSMFMASGIPLLIVILWHNIQPNFPPPDFVYLPMINTITISVSVMMVISFMLQKTVRDIVCARKF